MSFRQLMPHPMRDYRNQPGGTGFAILQSGWNAGAEGLAICAALGKESFMLDPEKSRNRSEATEDHSVCGLLRAMFLETLLVFLAGLLILGLAWEAGFFWAGLIVALVIWLTVSPAIDFATYRHWRRG
ncbi:MAG TPA: hypothetical protein VH370_17580 [Humisphaera sp.]|jgi:hypothetical protein|nr:hypothetical protein [Humisphaera sp.]